MSEWVSKKQTKREEKRREELDSQIKQLTVFIWYREGSNGAAKIGDEEEMHGSIIQLKHLCLLPFLAHSLLI